jgi:predicted O-methyltransferase YrrM
MRLRRLALSGVPSSADEQPRARRRLAQLLMPDGAWPIFGGAEIEPDTAVVLAETVLGRTPQSVLDVGGGTGCVVLALALRRAGSGRLTSVHHDEARCARTRDLLAAHGVADVAQVVHEPLGAFAETGVAAWHEASALSALARRSGGTWDLAFVPPSAALAAHEALEAALPALLPSLSASATVVVDEALRREERDVLARWQESGVLAGFDSRIEETTRGTLLLTRRATP